jgi:prepilin-type N-terminal cleavage/methylation domain-containing protein
MRIEKRRGFTIIEMIVAIAFFTIATISITFVVNTSSNMYKTEDTKFHTISVADSILNQLKSRGIVETDPSLVNNITGLNYFFGTSDDTDEYEYIFLNYDELSSETLLKISYHVTTAQNDEDSNDTQNFELCKTYNTDNKLDKQFGAVVHISRGTNNKTNSSDDNNFNIDYYYNNYTIDVKVWDLNEDVTSEAEESTSISR